MKKWMSVIFLGATCLVLAACGSGGSGAKTPPAQEIAQAVINETAFVDAMSFVSAEQFPKLYRIDMEKVEEASMYAGTLASAEEVTVIRMKDAADVELAVTAMEERLEDQKIAFESYIPEEMTKINGAQIYTNGPYACLVVADDNSGAKAVFESQFTGK